MLALETPSPEVVAEFAAVAGRLSLLKSRALLPRPPRAPEAPEDPDDLIRQLEEYRALKVAAGLLADKLQFDVGAFGRGDGVAAPAAIPGRMAPQEPNALANAVSRWLSRMPRPTALVSTLPVVTLREMIQRVIAALSRERDVAFDGIRSSCRGRQDVAVAFLAILVLLRRQAIVATQSDLFGPIRLSQPPDRLLQLRPEGELTAESAHGRD